MQLYECAGLAEVLLKIIAQEMKIVDAVGSGRLYADVKTDAIRYDGN